MNPLEFPQCIKVDFHRVSVHRATKNLPVVVLNIITTGSGQNQAKKQMLRTWDSEATVLLTRLYDFMIHATTAWIESSSLQCIIDTFFRHF